MGLSQKLKFVLVRVRNLDQLVNSDTVLYFETEFVGAQVL